MIFNEQDFKNQIINLWSKVPDVLEVDPQIFTYQQNGEVAYANFGWIKGHRHIIPLVLTVTAHEFRGNGHLFKFHQMYTRDLDEPNGLVASLKPALNKRGYNLDQYVRFGKSKHLHQHTLSLFLQHLEHDLPQFSAHMDKLEHISNLRTHDLKRIKY